MSCPTQVVTVNADQFTSEEVIEKAIKDLLEKRQVLDASIEVFKKRLRYLRFLSIPITSEEYKHMRSLKESSTHPLPSRERSTASQAPSEVTLAGD